MFASGRNRYVEKITRVKKALFFRRTKNVCILRLSQQDGICDKNSAPSISSISRLLRGGRRDELKNHSIDGILGKSQTIYAHVLLCCIILYVMQCPSPPTFRIHTLVFIIHYLVRPKTGTRLSSTCANMTNINNGF